MIRLSCCEIDRSTVHSSVAGHLQRDVAVYPKKFLKVAVGLS